MAAQASTVAYTQDVNALVQSIEFEPSVAADWVILHLTTTGGSGSRSPRATNLPMTGQGTYFRLGPIPMVAGDVLSYSFTYSINGAATNTATYTYTVPAGFLPPSLSVKVGTAFGGGRELEVAVDEFWGALSWADVHYTINGGPQHNVRTTAFGGLLVQPLALNPGDVVSYWMSYETGSSDGAFVMESDTLTYVEPAPVANLLTLGWNPNQVTAGFSPISGLYVLDPTHPNDINLPMEGKSVCYTNPSQNLTFEQAITAPSSGSVYQVTLDVNTAQDFACFGVTLNGVAPTSYQGLSNAQEINGTVCATPTQNVIQATINVPLTQGQTVQLALSTWTINAGRGNCGAFQESYMLNDAQLVKLR